MVAWPLTEILALKSTACDSMFWYGDPQTVSMTVKRICGIAFRRRYYSNPDLASCRSIQSGYCICRELLSLPFPNFQGSKKRCWIWLMSSHINNWLAHRHPCLGAQCCDVMQRHNLFIDAAFSIAETLQLSLVFPCLTFTSPIPWSVMSFCRSAIRYWLLTSFHYSWLYSLLRRTRSASAFVRCSVRMTSLSTSTSSSSSWSSS